MGIVTRQILYSISKPDIIYACGLNAAKLALPSDKLFLWTDYDQVIIEFDMMPLSTNTSNGRILGTYGTTRQFTVATVNATLYWLINNSQSGTISNMFYANTKLKLRFVFDIANNQILLTRTESGTATSYTKSISSGDLSNLGTEALTIGGHDGVNTGNTVYIWKNSMLIQKVKDNVTTTVLNGLTAVPGVDYIVDGATIVTL